MTQISARGEVDNTTGLPDEPVKDPYTSVQPLSFWERYRSSVLGTAGVVGLLGLWQFISGVGLVSTLYISSPVLIVQAIPEAFADDDFMSHIGVSAQEFGIGMALVVITGIPAGLIAGWYRTIRELTDPVISALFSTPVVALVPILVLVFGIGIWSKVAVVYLLALWPLIINTTAGIRDIDPETIRMARTFGARNGRIFRTIALPASVPYIITGLRSSVARGIIAVVVGELYAASAGVGYYLNRTGQIFQTDRYYFAVLFLAMVGVALGVALTRIEAAASKWKVDR
jgi:ABC-type nitrate/sulfonate/bicarbonate transport system permease component